MDDTTVLVTGGSRGIGAAVASHFAAEGAAVAISARREDEIEAVVTEIRGPGVTVTAHRADVRDEYDVERLVAAVRNQHGTLDVLVTCAGVYHGHPGETPLAGESYRVVDDHLRTNARGVYATIREAVPALSPAARVLVPSGDLAREARPGFGSYAVSKAAAEAFARGFAAELDQVVGVVDPGQVTTTLTVGARGREPAAVAPLFRWAALEAPAEMVDGAVVGLKEWRQATR